MGGAMFRAVADEAQGALLLPFAGVDHAHVQPSDAGTQRMICCVAAAALYLGTNALPATDSITGLNMSRILVAVDSRCCLQSSCDQQQMQDCMYCIQHCMYRRPQSTGMMQNTLVQTTIHSNMTISIYRLKS